MVALIRVVAIFVAFSSAGLWVAEPPRPGTGEELDRESYLESTVVKNGSVLVSAGGAVAVYEALDSSGQIYLVELNSGAGEVTAVSGG